jgi:pimeloyl-ACP methyl ester carboxylesterase
MNGKVDRRALLASVGGAAAVLSGEMVMAAQPETESLPPGAKRASDRLGFKYRFDDPDMDLFFVIACGWGRAGGLDIGEAYYVAQSIKDGDAESWVASFEASGDRQQKLADDWQTAGWKYQSAQVRLKAFASYRSAWQFAPIGPVFDGLYAKHKAAFRPAIPDLGFLATFFGVPYLGKSLPGLFVQNADWNAPVVLLLGGADTCFEEIFLTVGRNVYEQGYSVAMIDLPGQGLTMKDGLHWEAETERPIGATIDVLIERFGAKPGRIGMLGYSLGGYFVTRAAGYEKRLGAVMASTPLPHAGLGFPELVKRWRKEDSEGKMSSATRRNVDVIYWKMGASNDEEFIAKASRMIADPSLVTVPFLSIVGTGEGPGFQYDGKNWHETIRSTQKRFVALDASTGADGHVQAANRLRLAQEMCGWMDTIFRT